MDLNNDGIQSNSSDGSTFAALFGSVGTPSIADANCDQIVGGPDHGSFIRVYLTPPGPSGLWCAGVFPCP
jgi:hypothetical protein